MDYEILCNIPGYNYNKNESESVNEVYFNIKVEKMNNNKTRLCIIHKKCSSKENEA